MESWANICCSFLMRYNQPNMHTQLKNDIASFRQADDESMYECWDIYKWLLRKCTYHDFQDWTQVVMFYNGVNAPTRMMLDASANDTLLDKSLEEAFDILDQIANNDYQFPTARLGAGRRAPGKLDLDASDSVSAQLSVITNMLKNLQKSTDVRDDKALSYVHCERNHHANDYPTMHESASYVGNYNKNANNPYSNTYNPCWRQHPIFSWGNQGGSNKSNANRQQNMNAPPGFQTNMPWQSEAKGNASTSHNNSMEAMMQEFISALENQVGQIVQALQVRPQGSLPSDTEVTKRNDKEQCTALTLRSGTTINKNVEFEGKENTEASPVPKHKEFEVQEEAQEEEGQEEVLTTNPSGGQFADVAAKTMPTHSNEDVRPPPSFPQILKKHKEDNQFKKFREGRIKVNIKDLKPKRIKDYLECKLNQRKRKVNPVHVRNQKHELTPPRNRANPRGPRFDYDPELERTRRRLKQEIHNLMNRNNGQQPADGQELPARADGAIAPPAPQMNQQMPARTVRDYLAEDLEGLNPAVTMPDFEAEHFELKPVMFNMLNTLGQFGGTPNENARQHG
ncbi:hypothetical protein GQ457_03G013430 [Hibiscus cannabinus]